MILAELLKMATDGYRKGFLGEEVINDGLARFISREIIETFDPNASDEDQIAEAVRVMAAAKNDLDNVIDALLRPDLTK